ncbi:membrane protein [Knoellia sinensis KCTC 19936]|uniref:GDT1 family protein n=1 Tax=Knoellia sinensis KCTC 19936 TaxID=1385520 RepID=A0A0A0J5I1_9MICO|nr:TMEM165/GDT1 family protein [Knoellia sinensis]KGN31357.1 membrane protein [Knoellia sinensis KCTC 19936]
MGIDFVTIAIVFGTIFVVELPDKTFIATLVMSTRFRPLLVWLGVVAAFFVQTLVAVAIGGVLAQLPKRPIEIVAAVLFLIGGIILLRGASKADAEEAETEEEFGEKSESASAKHLAGWKIITFSFTVLFLAEWGDLSQILTASMVLRFDDPVSVFIGAFLALAAVSGVAALLGRTLLQRIHLSTIRRIGGVVCLILATVSALQIFGVI